MLAPVQVKVYTSLVVPSSVTEAGVSAMCFFLDLLKFPYFLSLYEAPNI